MNIVNKLKKAMLSPKKQHTEKVKSGRLMISHTVIPDNRIKMAQDFPVNCAQL
jgi:hypothetical protein